MICEDGRHQQAEEAIMSRKKWNELIAENWRPHWEAAFGLKLP